MNLIVTEIRKIAKPTFIICSSKLVNTFNQLSHCKKYRFLSSQSALRDLLISMPKVPVHVEKLKSQRQDKRDNTTKYNAGFINLQVLGNGARGAPTSLYVFTDQTRYIFNCGEGSQRLAHEHKLKLSKLEHIFITSKLWSRIGGLPGLALTIQDIGIPSVTIHGPPELGKLFEAAKRFIILKDLQILTTDCTEEASYYEDHVMRIDYVPLLADQSVSNDTEDTNSEFNNINFQEEDNVDYYANAKGLKRTLEGEKLTNVEKKPRTVEAEAVYKDCVLCYICRPKPKPGTLIIEKCIEFGVPPGPLLGKLKSGQDVTLSTGKIVKASDVTTPLDLGPVFIIVDCPDERYLDSLVTNDCFVEHQKSGSEDDTAHVVVHFTPKKVMQNSKYINWMQSFRDSAKHLLINDLCEGAGSEAVHRAQLKLHQLDSEIFPLLGETSIPVTDGDNLGIRANGLPKEIECISSGILTGSTLLKYNLRPTIGLDEASGVTLNPALYTQELKDTEGFVEELENYKLRTKQLQTDVQEYPKIIFLGTGSCIPNKTRNTSGILVQTNSDSFILLDCGEGTFGQLVRYFGVEKIDEILVLLSAVYISHLHADHHLGLMTVIMERYRSFEKLGLAFTRLKLIAPYQISTWMNLFDKYFEKIQNYYDLIPNSSLHINGMKIQPEEYQTYLLDPMNISEIKTVGVRHCPNAFGVSVTGTDGWKLTYSGDTMPCDSLVTLGQNSDVLIHEATMEDELKEEAVYKMHSTVSEAIDIGKKMNAKFTILTHFSQRYSKVPKINKGLADDVGVAFDNMCVRFSDLPKLPQMYPALKTLFAEHYEEMELRTAKKMLRKQKILAKGELLDNTTTSRNKVSQS